ncbi:nitric-oxide reductase large subunit [Psychrobacter sp. AOP22-C1-22]|uniref:nitric-oxide reductase large subunit n=1 Tax=unclassified Psychrobacter TaxID=196806 RepID=UPI0017883AAE|nr:MULTISPECIES: nitric-oxide reductase large subunit [unclassified Psychrobacter]MBE0407317.1 nitric-oxide reductase large subunit [Psychrobacter sp. FME6]MBE0445501.1 nitric-oxide reductase large subunit [Psychrobacter sp. FME5]MDN5802275.1 nitric-oxide reductase large subunit [Psychrobacter sp.]
MGEYKKYWFGLLAVLIITFTFLGWGGVEIYRTAPPIPDQYIDTTGKVLITEEDILDGQSAWQRTGGQQLGSVLGHGAYQAPDWTADWLHRELVAWLDIRAEELYGRDFATATDDQKAVLNAQLKKEYRGSSVNDKDQVVLSDTRIAAMNEIAPYYIGLYGNEPSLQKSRENFAMKNNTLPNLEDRQKLTNFFFWTTWMASTNRPGTDATYTNNWPHEPLIDNVPTSENIMWSIASVVFLIAGVGFLIWGWSFLRKEEEVKQVTPDADPLTKIALTPSQKALAKYGVLVVALFVFQVFIGGFVAHYTVEGQEFYGIPVADFFPYSLVRTWHIQAALFWIATAFLTAGLFLTPFINGGKDPKYQKLGVDILWFALIIVVVGSFVSQYFAIAGIMPAKYNFWFGHQGYEFIDLGRFWQILKWVGILFWLVLMTRGCLPAFKQKGGDKNLLAIFFASVVCVGLFYGAGLFYGERTHLTIMEYWRWWVVHLWVEGFFEVFATVSLAFIFYNLGLVNKKIATGSAIASAALFMLGGVPGTFHHLYYSGTTTPVMAIGASFSALEVVPLVVLGYEGYEHWSMQRQAPWMNKLKWPIMCFVAVAFWNMLGAGVLGFMINPPVSLFYLQGLNTTAAHSHAALFGVYGFLAIGFILLVMRYIRPDYIFNEKLIKTGFWALNIGLVLMLATSLLPIGIYQAYASMTEGLWYARSEGFLQQDFLQTLRWIRTFADVIFIVGAVCVALQVVKFAFAKPSHANYKPDSSVND